MSTSNFADALIDNQALIHSLGVLCKDNCFISEIDRLFVYAGADRHWRSEFPRESSSQRIHRVYEWARGLKENASDEVSEEIIRSFAAFVLRDVSVHTAETYVIRQLLDGEATTGRSPASTTSVLPSDIDQLLEHVIKGLPRAMYPFRNRRKNKAAIQFSDEYDLQDLFHALLRPWVKDIRPEEYTPSYVGSSTRMDFLLRAHKIVCELKFVRSASHAKEVGGELTIDIAHYRQHPNCESLFAVIYDPNEYIANPDGFVCDLESNSENPTVKVFILPTRTLS